jgi:hypothetical protein
VDSAVPTAGPAEDVADSDGVVLVALEVPSTAGEVE